MLVGGRIEQVAPVAELYAAPRALAVARLVGGFTELPGTVEGGRHRSAAGTVDLSPVCTLTGPPPCSAREELELTTEAGAAAADLAVSGTVVRTRLTGPRQTATVRSADPGARPARAISGAVPGQRCGLADPVHVRLRAGVQGWAVARGPGDTEDTGDRTLSPA